MSPSDQQESRPPVDGVTVHASHANWAMGELGPCLVVVWKGNVTEEALLQINERIFDLSQRHPGKCAYINVIQPNSPVPSAPMRKLAMAGVARPGNALTCMAAVMEGNEFRSTVVRAVITGMMLLRPQVQPTKIFKDTNDMSGWVKKHLPGEGDDLDSKIVRAVEVIRSQAPA